MRRSYLASLSLAVALALSSPFAASTARAAVPPPVDVAYPGTIDIEVDATDLAQRIFRVKQERSEEHTSELQSLMRISYAVFCLKKKKSTSHHNNSTSRTI